MPISWQGEQDLVLYNIATDYLAVELWLPKELSGSRSIRIRTTAFRTSTKRPSEAKKQGNSCTL